MSKIRLDDVIAVWRDRHRAEWSACYHTANDYAYGVADYRLGGRASLPNGATLVVNVPGSREKAKAAPKRVRAQVDAIIEELS